MKRPAHQSGGADHEHVLERERIARSRHGTRTLAQRTHAANGTRVWAGPGVAVRPVTHVPGCTGARVALRVIPPRKEQERWQLRPGCKPPNLPAGIGNRHFC